MTNNIWDTTWKYFPIRTAILFTFKKISDWAMNEEIATLKRKREEKIRINFESSQKRIVNWTSKKRVALSGRRNWNSISFDSWCYRSETGKSKELIDPSDTWSSRKEMIWALWKRQTHSNKKQSDFSAQSSCNLLTKWDAISFATL